MAEQANVELVARTRLDTPNLDVAPELMVQPHVFTFEGHDVSVSLPSADRVTGLTEHGIETFSDDRVYIRSWRKQDGQPELLAIAVGDVDVEVGIPGTCLLPQEARTRQVTHNSYSEEQRKHLDELVSDYGNVANRVSDLWIRTVRWKTGNYRIGLPHQVSDTEALVARTEIREKDTLNRFMKSPLSISAYMPAPVKVEVWDMVGAALRTGEYPPIYYDLLFSAWAALERGNLQRTIVDAAVAAETYIRTIVYDGLPPNLDDPVREYIERTSINLVREKFYPARLDAQQKENYRTFKGKLEQLFTHRNNIMHKGRKEGLTADHCTTLVKSVSELIRS